MTALELLAVKDHLLKHGGLLASTRRQHPALRDRCRACGRAAALPREAHCYQCTTKLDQADYAAEHLGGIRYDMGLAHTL